VNPVPDDRNRRSSVVFLSLIGLASTVAIADEAIPQPVEMRRNVYANRADCLRDYPPPPDQCEAQSSGGGGSGGGYHGPYYSSNRSSATTSDPGPGRAGTTAVAHETSYRGGFGAFGRAIHAVG
jgi:hypothetical protein